ncbi:MAG: glycosyltransferase family 4 protein [Flavobacteriales bacterium]|nr:glycosyltransferase family 4 protein [Flavobacteriales bacterium]
MELRILFLTDGLFPYVMGGMQKHSFSLCEQLLAKGVKVTLFHALPQGMAVDEKKVRSLFKRGTENLMVRSFTFPSKDNLPGHYVRENIVLSNDMYNKYKEEGEEYDMIYGQGFTAHAFIKADIDIPIFIHFHGYEMWQKAASLKTKAEHLLLRKTVKWMSLHADYVFSFGGQIKQILDSLGVEPDKQIEFPLGISSSWTTREIRPNQDKPTFVFIGRNERRKGMQELKAALSSLIKENREFHFHFIGPIEKEERIADDRLSYHGQINEVERIKEILKASDVLVSPSYSEGMPTVILESMSQGLAILATDVGAVSKMVDSENGWLIEAGNVRALNRALTEALEVSGENLLEKKRASLTRFKDNFVWEDLITDLTFIFREKVLAFQKDQVQA